nr:ATP-dependent RNA helicase DEAH11, chloroplastic-like [Ipomoea batatas]
MPGACKNWKHALQHELRIVAPRYGTGKPEVQSEHDDTLKSIILASLSEKVAITLVMTSLAMAKKFWFVYAFYFGLSSALENQLPRFTFRKWNPEDYHVWGESIGIEVRVDHNEVILNASSGDMEKVLRREIREKIRHSLLVRSAVEKIFLDAKRIIFCQASKPEPNDSY